MKQPCDLVKDLLPLYHDAVCSESSKKIVEAHISECDSCKQTLEKMNDNSLDNGLREERKNVVGRYTQKIKRKSMLVGICFAAVLAIPILVCLIVNLATGHGLDWFFIVLASLLVFASVTVVPLMLEKYKGLWTLGSFTASLLLLLLVCCLYTGGNWFFVAALPILFGLSLIFLPFVLRALPLQGFAARHKGLLVMGADTILLYALVIVAVLYGNRTNILGTALLHTSINALFPWILFLVIRYVNTSGFTKAGICTIVGGVYFSLIHDISNRIDFGYWRINLAHANLSLWNEATINPNIYLLVLLAGCIAGTIFLLLGATQRHRKGK